MGRGAGTGRRLARRGLDRAPVEGREGPRVDGGWGLDYRCVVIGGTNNPFYPAFKALIDVLCYPMRLLDGHGRLGGTVSLVLGVGMLWAGWWVATTTSLWGLGVCGVGAAYCAYGLSRLVGREARLQQEYDTATKPSLVSMSRPEIEQVIASRPVPFFVCTRCRLAMAPEECGGQCPKCGSETDCMPVQADADRATVKASLY